MIGQSELTFKIEVSSLVKASGKTLYLNELVRRIINLGIVKSVEIDEDCHKAVVTVIPNLEMGCCAKDGLYRSRVLKNGRVSYTKVRVQTPARDGGAS